MSDCAFCGIVAGTEPATVVGEWPDVMAFAEIDPIAPGHTLVVPKWHMTKASDGAYDFSKVMRRAAEVSANLAASNIIASNGHAAKQSVEHLHVHVIPRAEGDQLMVPWGTTGDPHDPHWCRVADDLQREVDVRYPRRCSQCGQRWADRACGPTHALIAEELGLNDLRRELAKLREEAARD